MSALVSARPYAPQRYQCKIFQSTGMATQMQLEVILAGNRIATRVLWSSDSKESIKTKTKSRNCFCIRVRVYKELSVWLIVMSTNLESRERDLERQRKRKNRRQASEAQREKERRRAWAREFRLLWSNGIDHFGLVRPECSGPALKVVLFDLSGYFGR